MEETYVADELKYCEVCIAAKSPAFRLNLQLSSRARKSPAELGLTNFVIHISCKLLFHKRKTVHDLRNREIYEKSEAN